MELLIPSLMLNIVLVVALLFKHGKLNVLKIPDNPKPREWTDSDWAQIAFGKAEVL
jgi:hypothetical protein